MTPVWAFGPSTSTGRRVGDFSPVSVVIAGVKVRGHHPNVLFLPLLTCSSLHTPNPPIPSLSFFFSLSSIRLLTPHSPTLHSALSTHTLLLPPLPSPHLYLTFRVFVPRERTGGAARVAVALMTRLVTGMCAFSSDRFAGPAIRNNGEEANTDWVRPERPLNAALRFQDRRPRGTFA